MILAILVKNIVVIINRQQTILKNNNNFNCSENIIKIELKA